jgi:hypothetical protein
LATVDFVVSHTSKIRLRQWLQQATSVIAGIALLGRPSGWFRSHRFRIADNLAVPTARKLQRSLNAISGWRTKHNKALETDQAERLRTGSSHHR